MKLLTEELRDEIFEEFAKRDLDPAILASPLIFKVIKYSFKKGYKQGKKEA